MNRGNVISSLLLLQPIACLHLILNNCWQNLRKPPSAPPPSPLPPKSLSDHIIQKSLGGSAADEHTLSSSPISAYQEPFWLPLFSDFSTRIPSDVIAAHTGIDSAALDSRPSWSLATIQLQMILTHIFREQQVCSNMFEQAPVANM